MNEHQKPTSSLSQKESSEASKGLKVFIDDGLLLMSSDQHAEAIKYFDNPEKAKGFGIGWRTGRDIILTEAPDPSTFSRLISDMGLWGNFSHQLNAIELPSLIGFNFKSNERIEIPEPLYHNLALISAEEWLHALQFASKSSLTGEIDSETDVALYMKRKGVQLTEVFLKGYDRQKHPELQ